MSTKENERIQPRLLSISDLARYTGLGKTKARTWAESLGALRKIGTRALYDLRVIDAALDGQKGEGRREQ